MPLRLPIWRPAAPARASMPLAAPPPYCIEAISLLVRRSHTDVNPEDELAAKMRATVGFHCREVISLSLVDVVPGGMGLVGLFRS